MIQYKGAPLTPEQIVESFDLTACRVTTSIAPHTAHYQCQLSHSVRTDIEEGRLRLTKYAWPPLYVKPLSVYRGGGLDPDSGDSDYEGVFEELLDEASWETSKSKALESVIIKQIHRFNKYINRGFTLKRE